MTGLGLRVGFRVKVDRVEGEGCRVKVCDCRVKVRVRVRIRVRVRDTSVYPQI